MSDREIAKDLLRVARDVTARVRFTARVDRVSSGPKRLITFASPVGTEGGDKSAMVATFDRVTNEAERIMKATSYSLGAKFRMATTMLRMDVRPPEFVVDAVLIDQVSTPDEIVFALKEDMAIRDAWTA